MPYSMSVGGKVNSSIQLQLFSPMAITVSELQTELSALEKKMQSFTKVIDEINNKIKTLTEAEEFDVFVQTEITPYFGESTAENIITTLQKCRREGNNYNYFSPVYQWKTIYGDYQKRQLLKMISSVYRIKYLNKNKNSNVCSLKSDMKYAKECPECGKLATAFYDRLIAEGLIK